MAKKIPWGWVKKVVCTDCGANLSPLNKNKVPTHLPKGRGSGKVCDGTGRKPNKVIGPNDETFTNWD